ncbi:hypothetical protein GCM10008938_47550 [Deinococcus roseus]|uniref:Transposase n=1 Tax=Deinococcus roseus TaxID=392414 RepID=A0ABQ2DJL8_9DEIO|nr:hypothetical protein GCM10008938_47550 [Deinococcus roseus]
MVTLFSRGWTIRQVRSIFAFGEKRKCFAGCLTVFHLVTWLSILRQTLGGPEKTLGFTAEQ